MRAAAFGLALLASVPVLACNPSPPRPPILEGYPYDLGAARVLVRDSASVVTARYSSPVELDLGGQRRTSYVFEVLEGWKDVVPRRLTVDGYWIDCELALRPGAHYLLYLDGERVLFALPAESLGSDELDLLGDLTWYYGPAGNLVRPVESEGAAGDEG